MEIVPSGEIEEIQTFLAQYFSFEAFPTAAVFMNEQEWKAFGPFIRNFKQWEIEWFMPNLVELAKSRKGANKLIQGEPGEAFTHQGMIRESPWTQVGGYFCQTVPLLVFIKNYMKDGPAKRAYSTFLDGTRFAIFLRERASPDRISRLVAIFHEVLHTIELTTQKPIYRGDTPQQEARDEKEIVEPLVKQFMHEHEKF